jgi:hypothetical protein
MQSKWSKSQATRRSLFLENLEGRALLAGNVLAAVDGSVLKITGDDAANGVLIRLVSEKPAGSTTPVVKIAVVGVPTRDGTTTVPTTINGYGRGFLVSPEGLTGISVNLGAGNDGLGINNPPPADKSLPPVPVRLPGTVSISTGEGNDSVSGMIDNNTSVSIDLGNGSDRLSLGGSRVKDLGILTDGTADANVGEDQVFLERLNVLGKTNIGMGAGVDKLGIKGAAFAGPVGIGLGPGNDNVLIAAGVDAPPVNFAAGLEINGGLDNDVIGLANVTLAGATSHLKIVGDPLPPAGSTTPPLGGDDQVLLDTVKVGGNTHIAAGVGNDRVGIKGASAFTGPVGIGLGAGNDGLLMGSALGAPAITFAAGLEVGGDLGDDNIGLSGVNVTGRLSVNAGAGNDRVALDRVNATDRILAALGAGNDHLGVKGSKSPLAAFDGGEDTDAYLSLDNTFGATTSVNFEPLPPPK